MVEEGILALAASPWVYLAMYVLTTLDGFFPPVPSESVVIALAAVATSSGVPNLALVLAVAAAGAFTGDQVAYAIGRRVHVRSTRLLRGKRVQQTVDWAEHALTHRGAAFILGARFIPVARVAVNMTAGALGYPRARFVGLTGLAAVAWALYSTAIGVGAGAVLHDRPVVAVVVGVVGGAAIGLAVDWVLGRFQRLPTRHRTRTARTSSPSDAGPAATGGTVAGTSGDERTVAAAPVASSGTSPVAAAPVVVPVLREAEPAMVLPSAERL